MLHAVKMVQLSDPNFGPSLVDIIDSREQKVEKDQYIILLHSLYLLTLASPLSAEILGYRRYLFAWELMYHAVF